MVFSCLKRGFVFNPVGRRVPQRTWSTHLKKGLSETSIGSAAIRLVLMTTLP
jgi:hypothetical protein